MSEQTIDIAGSNRMPAQVPSTLVSWIDHQLREAILEGEFVPGQRLLVSELTSRWNVSPTPVREALRGLAMEGLVEIIPQRGARVARVSKADLLDLYRVRLLLEPPALRDAINHGNPRSANTIQATFDALVAEYRSEGSDMASRERVHREFHMAILDSCSSDWLRRLISTLIDHSARYRAISVELRGDDEHLLAEHRSIMEACLAGDSEGGAQQLERHLSRTIDTAMNRLDNEFTDE